MKHKNLFLLTIFGLLLTVYISGCTNFIGIPDTNFGDTNSQASVVSLDKFVERSDTKILLDVLAFAPPGTWSGTRNCGHACAVMMRAYYYGIEPLPEHIIQVDDWLNAWDIIMATGLTAFRSVPGWKVRELQLKWGWEIWSRLELCFLRGSLFW